MHKQFTHKRVVRIILALVLALVLAGALGGTSASYVAASGGPTLRRPLTPHDLGTLPGTLQSFAYGINPRGDVVGTSQIHSVESRAFLLQNGTMTDLSALGQEARATAISPAGAVVGSAHLDMTSGYHAFLYEHGTVTDLGTLPGGSFSVATAINPARDIVGYSRVAGGARHAFLYRHGTMTDLGTLGGSWSEAAVGCMPGQPLLHFLSAQIINPVHQSAFSTSLPCR